MMQKLVALTLITGALGLIPLPANAQTVDLNAAVALRQGIRAVPDIVYLRANGWEGRLDVYAQDGQAQKAGVPNEHITIPKAGHGNFSIPQWQDSFARIKAFLASHNAGVATSP